MADILYTRETFRAKLKEDGIKNEELIDAIWDARPDSDYFDPELLTIMTKMMLAQGLVSDEAE